MLSGLIACRDESLNPIPTTKLLDGVTFTAVATSSAFLDLAKLDAAKMDFTTSTLRPDLIKQVDVVAEWVPASGPKVSKPLMKLSSVIGTNSIPFSQFLNVLGITGSQLKPGDIIKAKFVVTTPDGRTFSEDNTVGTLPSTGSSGFTRSLNATVACVFSGAQFATGTWLVTLDQWGDWKVGSEVSVTPGPGANELTIDFYGSPKATLAAGIPAAHKPTVITVSNLKTGAITVAKQVYGIYEGDVDTYSMEGTGSLSGCAGTIDLVLKHTNNVGYASAATPSVKFSLKRK